MSDFASGMHRAAQIVRELSLWGRNSYRKDGKAESLAAATALEAALAVILAEADQEVTPSAEICSTCGQAVKQRTVVIPSGHAG